MSREDLTCKLYKHKERKPKKPHYIPRPWGKPYNYKCFQCPFTCLEKSHLYNHMKYSLCKNSLSLLVGSDWPYGKGHVLHSDPLPLRAAEEVVPAAGAEAERAARGGEGTVKPDFLGEDREAGGLASPERGRGRGRGTEEEEEEEEEDGGEAGDSPGPAGDPEIPPVSRSNKPDKKAEADIVITDVFSLRNPAGKAEELEAKRQRYRPPVSVSNGGILRERWRLLTSGGQRKAPVAAAANPPSSSSSPPSADAHVIPCYPPPAALAANYREPPPGLNLSLLGVNYPVTHGGFSYLSPAIAGYSGPPGVPALMAAQLPFLAPSARSLHPHSGHPLADAVPHRRSRFFYPLLLERTLSPGEGKRVGGAAAANEPDPGRTPGPAPPQGPAPPKTPDGLARTQLRKVPALRPVATSASATAIVAHNCLVRPETSPRAQAAGRNREGPTSVPSVAASEGDDVKRRFPDAPSPASAASGPAPVWLPDQARPGLPPRSPSPGNATRPKHNSCQPSVKGKVSPPPPKPLSSWSPEPCVCLKNPPDSPRELGSPSPPASPPGGDPSDRKGGRNPAESLRPGEEAEGDEGSTVLIDDLCKVIHEYREVEEQLCLLGDRDRPGQKPLRSRLARIRDELLHIRRALEKTARQPEGPLDLSVKRSLDGMAKSHRRSGGERGGGGGLDNQGLPISPGDGVRPADGSKESGVGGWTTATTTTTSSPRLENRSTPDAGGGRTHGAGDLRPAAAAPERGVGEAEVKPGGGGGGGGGGGSVGGGGGSELPKDWPTLANRTTKCEADSSVPLGVDARPSWQPGQLYPGPGDAQPPRCKGLKRLLSGECPSEREKRSRLSPLVGERLTAVKQSRVV